MVVAARRAGTKVRRYCAANRLNRLGTLTYRGVGCHDISALRTDLGIFFRRLRRGLGGYPFAYVWVGEWHPGGHGLHAHFAVARFIWRGQIAECWPHGFVHIKLLGDLHAPTTELAEARMAARYLSKYVVKAFDGRSPFGLHRYEVAQGFSPEAVAFRGPTSGHVVDQAVEHIGRRPSLVLPWDKWKGYSGPPAVFLSWS